MYLFSFGKFKEQSLCTADIKSPQKMHYCIRNALIHSKKFHNSMHYIPQAFTWGLNVTFNTFRKHKPGSWSLFVPLRNRSLACGRENWSQLDYLVFSGYLIHKIRLLHIWVPKELFKVLNIKMFIFPFLTIVRQKNYIVVKNNVHTTQTQKWWN